MAELYQNHGDHIDAIMPTSEFMQNHLRPIISESKIWKKVRTEVTAEDMENQRTDVASLKFGEGEMSMLTLLAYSSKSQTNFFMSIYPMLEGNVIRAKIEEVLEWDNQVEATIICSISDFEFAFFATDYYANKRSYNVGDTLSFELSALACKLEEAQRGFSFEGQQAIDWLAKIGQQPTYNENGEVEPVRFSLERLVTYLNHDSKCPDEGEFQSPVTNLKSTSLLNIDFYKGDIFLHRKEDEDESNSNDDLVLPLYFRKDFFPDVKESDPVRGWIWVIGQLAIRKEDASGENVAPPKKSATSNELSVVGEKFIEIVEKFDFSRFDDIMPILEPLDKIKIDDGYVVDVFKEGDRYGSRMQLYACKRDAQIKYDPQTKEIPLFTTKQTLFGKKEVQTGTKKEFLPYSDDMYIASMLEYEVAKAIPSVFTHLSIPFDQMGIWQAFLLHISPSMMPRDWHGGYGSRDYIFDLNILPNIKIDCSEFYNDESLLPRVDILDERNAVVTCTFWNSWRGLCKQSVRVNKDMSFEDGDLEILVEYDCGIRF